jgi:hypothetical protein
MEQARKLFVEGATVQIIGRLTGQVILKIQVGHFLDGDPLIGAAVLA